VTPASSVIFATLRLPSKKFWNFSAVSHSSMTTSSPSPDTEGADDATPGETVLVRWNAGEWVEDSAGPRMRQVLRGISPRTPPNSRHASLEA
jgi:hypothetical protein